MNKKAHATWLTMCITLAGGFEGCIHYVYRDPVGIPTYCFGETKNPEWGKKYSQEDCDARFAARLQEFDRGVSSCIHVPMSDERRAAVVSFTYNVGVSSFCHSNFARRLNENDPHACDELMKWTTAHKILGIRKVSITLPGLVNRRKAELKMCEVA